MGEVAGLRREDNNYDELQNFCGANAKSGSAEFQGGSDSTNDAMKPKESTASHAEVPNSMQGLCSMSGVVAATCDDQSTTNTSGICLFEKPMRAGFDEGGCQGVSWEESNWEDKINWEGYISPEVPLAMGKSGIAPEVPLAMGESGIAPEVPLAMGESGIAPEVPLAMGESGIALEVPLAMGESGIALEVPLAMGQSGIAPEVPLAMGESGIPPEVPLAMGESGIPPEVLQDTLMESSLPSEVLHDNASMESSIPTEVPQDKELMEVTFTTEVFVDNAMIKSRISTGIPFIDDIRKVVVRKMGGMQFSEQMERDGSLALLLSSLATRLQHYEEGKEVTSEVVTKEASKLMYAVMKSQNRKVVAHPQHITDLPMNFLLEHQHVYPSDKEYDEIAKDVELEKHQVVTLFENARKRCPFVHEKILELQAKVKSHFSKKARDTLSKWKSQNPGKRPDKKACEDLSQEAGISKRQVYDWIGNNLEGRQNRNKKIKTDKLIEQIGNKIVAPEEGNEAI